MSGVARFADISQLWQNFQVFGSFLKGYSVFGNTWILPTVPKFVCYWAYFFVLPNWPNIKKIIWQHCQQSIKRSVFYAGKTTNSLGNYLKQLCHI